jgi:hypothetical protein
VVGAIYGVLGPGSLLERLADVEVQFHVRDALYAYEAGVVERSTLNV